MECHSPIESHIDEAIAHNQKVAKRYAALSKGRSTKVSYTLINLERVSKLIVRSLDKEANLYHQHGIPVLCEEVPAMNAVPEFQERLPEHLRPQIYSPFPRKSLSSSLKKLMKDNQFEEAYQLIASKLYEWESEPNQQCLTRHFLESIAHTLKLVDKRREEARAAGLPDPLPLIKKYISLQRQTLLLTSYLDKQAFPLQKEGLLIFCQDVPAADWK